MREKKSIVELTRCSVEQYKAMRKLPLSVLTDNVRSMHNIGAIFRTADAFRVNEVILGGISGCPPHPEISKSALGAEESVAWRHVDSALDEVRRLQADGWRVCVLEQTHNSIPLQEFSLNHIKRKGEPDTDIKYKGATADDIKLVLVVGNEVNGVDQRIVDAADHILEIPQEGTKHSLNVSTSAAIALFHLFQMLNVAFLM